VSVDSQPLFSTSLVTVDEGEAGYVILPSEPVCNSSGSTDTARGNNMTNTNLITTANYTHTLSCLAITPIIITIRIAATIHKITITNITISVIIVIIKIIILYL